MKKFGFIGGGERNMTEFLSLKWGTIKGWDINTEASKTAAQKYDAAGKVSMSAMMQHDNNEQKLALCELIDVIDCPTIYLDWDGVYVSKEEAKKYVMEYGL